MFILPFIYLFSFLFAVWRTIRNQPQNILFFFIFGLSIYITALSIVNMYNWGSLVPALQSCKEISVGLSLLVLLHLRKRPLKFHLVDKLVLFYFGYNLLYVFLPLGTFSFSDKLLAFKSLCFFPFVYLVGRLIEPNTVNLNKYFKYICLLSILATLVLLVEVATNTHFQTYTGYAAFTDRFFGQEEQGSFGLSMTFETSTGLKRFASFFGQPLELGADTLLAISVIAALFTGNRNQIETNRFTATAFFMTLLCILFALSRASFVSYFIILYTYAVVTKKTLWLKIFHYTLLITVIAFLFYITGDLYDFIAGTIDFSDSSSAFHVFQWLDGIDAISAHPLGMGMGMSGRVSGAVGSNIGGENQLIITGVQTGIIATLVYIFLYGYIIHLCIKTFKTQKGKIRKLALAVLLIKTGMIIPTFTANAESYIYVAYMTWFLTGLLVGMVQFQQEQVVQTERLHVINLTGPAI